MSSPWTSNSLDLQNDIHCTPPFSDTAVMLLQQQETEVMCTQFMKTASNQTIGVQQGIEKY